jgi:glycosyltransferase involved in cell wall biosynthesis
MNKILGMQFVVIQNIPSPYRIHLFRVLQQELNERGVNLHVHFMARGHAERPIAWRNPDLPFPHTYWRDVGLKTHHWNPALIFSLLINRKADYLLVGSSWDTFTGICASLFARRKVGILWTEGNTKTPGRLTGMLGCFKRKVMSCYEYVAVPGQEGIGYVALHQQRTPRQMPKPVLLPNLIDESRFRVRAMWTNNEIFSARKRLGVHTSERLAVCPARFEPVKGLVEFFSKIPVKVLRGWKILVVGEGTQKARFKSVIRDRGLADQIIILNYVPYEEMPILYAASDLFLLPSVYDSNPLSVVEAMHSGLPLLLSKQVGNYPEALLAGATGWGFSPFDDEEIRLSSELAFGASFSQLQQYGQAAKEQAEKVWGSESAIREFADRLGIPKKNNRNALIQNNNS